MVAYPSSTAVIIAGVLSVLVLYALLILYR